MLLIRNFELAVKESFAKGKIPGFVHLSVGEEAVPVGVCSNLEIDDYVTSTHRGHGHCIAKGVDVKSMMAELYGKSTGACRGKGGSMHIFDPAVGMLGANGIVGAGAPIATGAGLSSKYRGTKQVAVSFFGDAAGNQGSVHEAMNLASVWKLPVIFVCENNQFAQYTRHEYESSVSDLSVRASGYGIPGLTVDGMDVLAVHRAAKDALKRARDGKGPSFLECKTYRFLGHTEGDPQTYRTPEEVEAWKRKDPIASFERALSESGLADESDFSRIEKDVIQKIQDSLNFADQSALPRPEDYLVGAYVQYSPSKEPEAEPKVESGRTCTYTQAINEALRQEMERDPTVFVMGENVASGGTTFGLTAGLVDIFGPERVRDTPLSEAGFVGTGVGAAVTGLRPVVELMFIDFIGVCLDQIMNQAAKLRYMSGGKLKVPLIVRTSYGAGLNAASQHSQSLYSFITHLPGLKCVVPSTPYDAKGLLISAIRQDDPIFFFENKALFNKSGEVPESDYTIPIGKADVKREGNDATIVAIGRMVDLAMGAASSLQNEGVNAEVLDLRSLSPMDDKAIIASVKKTGHLVIVDEAHPRCSMAADVAALTATGALEYLDGPIRLVTGGHTPVPFSPPMEKAFLPSQERIISAVRGIL